MSILKVSVLQIDERTGKIIFKVPMREFLSNPDILHLENVFFSFLYVLLRFKINFCRNFKNKAREKATLATLI